MILCCGEALIDMLPVAEGTAFAPHSGGAVFNTAIALARLGAPSGFFSGLSTDFFGDLLRASLSDSGVDCGLCVTSDRPTTLAFVRLVAGQASYAFYDENSAGRMLTETDLPEATAEAFFFGGISLAAEPCGAAYAALMACARGAGRVTMIDPNIRPGFVQNQAAYRARLARMLGMADIVKMSLEDLQWLAGGTGEGLVARLLAQGTALVLLTDGGKGATAVTARHRLSEPARAVALVDTVGAGDTFNAGVLASLHRDGALSRAALADLDESTLRAALRMGVAAAGVTVSRAGANPPWADEI